MKTIALITLLLACKQLTYVPHRSFVTKFYFSVDQDGKAVVIYAHGAKVPSTLHDFKVQADYAPLTTTKQSGNNISIDRLLRWQRALVSFEYKMGSTEISETCVVRWNKDKESNRTGQSFHENRLIEDCSQDRTLNVFARFCREKKGKFIYGEDVAPNNVYAKTRIELPDNSFACVFKRKGEDIVVPSYCFVDAYQDKGETIGEIFPHGIEHGFNVHGDQIDRWDMEAMLRAIDPAGVAIPKISHYACRYKKSSGSDGVGYLFLKNGKGPALEGLPAGGDRATTTQQPEVAQAAKVPQDYQELTFSMDTTPLTDVALQFDCPACRDANKHVTIHVLNISTAATINNQATNNNKIIELTSSQSTKIVEMKDLLFKPLQLNKFCLGLQRDMQLHELFKRCNDQLAFAVVDNAQTAFVYKHVVSTSYERTLPKACFVVSGTSVGKVEETASCGSKHNFSLTWLKKRSN